MTKHGAKPNRIVGPGTPYLVFLVAFLLTACLTAYLAVSIRGKQKERFQNEVRSISTRLSERMNTYVELLRATRGLWAVDGGRLTASQFRSFVRSLELEQNFPGLQGIGFAAYLRPDQVPEAVARRRSGGAPGFHIHPATRRSEYFPILYLEPQDVRNQIALGYDMYTDPVRRAAMERARDTGAPVLSGRVILVQEVGLEKQFGFLIYLPVYRNGWPTRTVGQRRAALLGFVYSPFRADDLFSSILGSIGMTGTSVKVYDGPEPDAGRLLHTSEADAPERGGYRSRHTAIQHLSIAKRLWTLQFRTSREFDRDTAGSVVPLVFCGGLAISILLFAVTLLQSRARDEAERVSDELRRSAEALQEASRAKDEFLAMLGHELRNPLGAISNALQVMASREITDPALRRARAVVERQVRHQTRLIEDLLDVSRVNSGKITLQCEVVDLRDVASRAVEGLQWAIDEQRHHLSTRVCEEELLVQGDPVRLEQVVTNLLHNAIKYTPEGGQVELSLGIQDNQVVLTVRDTGVGISAEMLDRIFDVFAQAQISIDRSKGGLGLGLTLVRNLVCMHGGTVSARSAGVGRGSEFEVRLPRLNEAELPEDAGIVSPAVYLPRQDEAPAGVRQERSAEKEPLNSQPVRHRVLVIEDIRDARETLQELLELQGYHVEVAADGLEGLSKLLASPPDVALVDIGLPGISGYEVVQRAREEERLTRVKFIALTGYGQPEDRRRALSAGFDAHVVKPVDPTELERLLIG